MIDPNKLSVWEVFNCYPIDPPISMFTIVEPPNRIKLKNGWTYVRPISEAIFPDISNVLTTIIRSMP